MTSGQVGVATDCVYLMSQVAYNVSKQNKTENIAKHWRKKEKKNETKCRN